MELTEIVIEDHRDLYWDSRSIITYIFAVEGEYETADLVQDFKKWSKKKVKELSIKEIEEKVTQLTGIMPIQFSEEHNFVLWGFEWQGLKFFLRCNSLDIKLCVEDNIKFENIISLTSTAIPYFKQI